VGLKRLCSFAAGSALLFFTGVLNAAPQLRLAATTLGPVSIAQGANGGTQTIEAGNAGDSQLSVSVSSSASWIAASVGAQRSCITMQGTQCFPVNLTLNTSALPAGLTTGIVTVTAPNAIDAPQTITVTVQIGGALAKDVHINIGQGKSADFKFYTNKFLDLTKTKSSATWLSVVLDGVGSFTFGVPYHLHVAAASNMPLGDYNATASLAGSADPIDNRQIGVFIHVTDQPAAALSTDKLTQRLAQGAPPLAAFVGLNNLGLGTLKVSDVQVSNAAWLKATAAGSGAALTFDVTGLSPGAYNGSISFTSNSVSSVDPLPVELTVVAQGPPLIPFNGVVDNAIFGAGDALTPGDIGVILGEQFSFSPLTVGKAAPLATGIGGTQVLVNGSPAPLYYTSYGQIAFQVPFGLTPLKDATVQVVRNGQPGNTVSVKIAPRAPRVLLVGVGAYGAIVNQDGSLPMPEGSFPGVLTHPAKPGDTLTIYAIGLGATSPGVLTGDPAPSTEPLSRVTATPVVNLFNTGSTSVTATPLFSGLTPTYAGLYQVNVTIPSNAPRGSNVNLTLGFTDAISNAAQIAIQ
jgi:uncharacterized protein (TIGR03437 family)